MRQDVRSLAVYDNLVWVFPGLSTDEKLQLQWSGIRTTWADSTTMPTTRPWVDENSTFSRDVEEYIELGLHWRIEAFDNKDTAMAAQYKALQDKKLREIIAFQVQQNRVSYPEIGATTCT